MEEVHLDRWDPAVAAVAAKYRCEEPHHHRVESFALQLLEMLRPFHFLAGDEVMLLRHAARLHDLGRYLGGSRHHRHGQYLIHNDELLQDYPEPARNALGLAVRNHRKGLRPALPELAPQVLQISALLRLADGLDGSRDPAVRLAGFHAAGREAWLFVHGLNRDTGAWLAGKACLVRPAFGCVLRVVGMGRGMAIGETPRG